MTSRHVDVGRLRETKYFAGFMAGLLLSAVVGFMAASLAKSNGIAWDRQLFGACFLGGTALSAQMAKGTLYRAPVRAWLLVLSGIVIGVAAPFLLD